MTEKNARRWMFGIGLLAGGVAGYLLNSDKGREVRRKAADTATEYGEKATVFAKEKAEMLNENFHTMVDKGEKMVNDFSGRFQEKWRKTAATAEELLDEVEGTFRKGLEKARRRVKENTRELEERHN